MVFKKIFSKAKKTVKKVKKHAKKQAKKLRFKQVKAKDAPNRFLKFYYTHREDLLKERREIYYEKVKNGECIRCTRRAIKRIKFCNYHRKKQEEYNRIARSKKLKETLNWKKTR
jgi:hypothetical protein